MIDNLKIINFLQDFGCTKLEHLQILFDNTDNNFKSILKSNVITKKGDIFVCLVGEHTDGHEFAQDAINSGATALLVERKVEGTKIPQVVVSSTRHKIADIADRFYSCPSKGINLIGVTGTNGKTTVTHLIQKIFEENNQKCALIGTLGYKLSSNGEYRDAKHTTPQAPELQATLRMIKDVEKIDNVVKSCALYNVGSIAISKDSVITSDSIKEEIEYGNVLFLGQDHYFLQ